MGANFRKIGPSFRRYFRGFNFCALNRSELERTAHLFAACDHTHGLYFHGKPTYPKKSAKICTQQKISRYTV